MSDASRDAERLLDHLRSRACEPNELEATDMPPEPMNESPPEGLADRTIGQFDSFGEQL